MELRSQGTLNFSGWAVCWCKHVPAMLGSCSHIEKLSLMESAHVTGGPCPVCRTWPPRFPAGRGLQEAEATRWPVRASVSTRVRPGKGPGRVAWGDVPEAGPLVPAQGFPSRPQRGPQPTSAEGRGAGSTHLPVGGQLGSKSQSREHLVTDQREGRVALRTRQRTAAPPAARPP